MALIAFASARSPGLTTTVTALAATWPAPRRALVVELDPDGGTLAARHATSPDPGLNSLAAAGRHYLWVNTVTAHLQQLPDGIPVLVAPPSPDRTVAAIETLNRVDLPGVLRSLPGFDVLVDCGRIDSRSVALPTLRAADAVIFVVRAALDDVIALQHRLQTLDLSRQAKAGIVAVGDHPYRREELAAAFTLPVVGVVDWDPRSAQTLGEGRRPGGASKLLKSAGRLAADVAAQVPAPEGVSDGEGPTSSRDLAGMPSAVWEPSRSNGTEPLPSAPLPSTGERSTS
jgi:hypothetical protein